ncbi:uncharacterized protein LOC144451302 [Glandiceps talaboti]
MASLRSAGLDQMIISSKREDLPRFKAIGERAGIGDGGRVAYRKDSQYVSALNKAVFVTEKALQLNQLFQIKIDRLDDKKPENLEFGVTMYNEFPSDVLYHGQSYGQGTGFWFLRGTDLLRHFEMVGGHYSLNLNMIKEGDVVGIVRLPNNTLHYYYNGIDQGIAFRDIPEGVYPLIAVTGKCLQVSIVDESSCLSPSTIPKAEQEAEYLEPFETYKFTTGTHHYEHLSRMRSPWGVDFVNESRHPEKAEILSRPDPIGRGAQSIQHEETKLFDKTLEVEKQSRKGYLNEADILFMINQQLSFATLMSQIRMDPVSKTSIDIINSSVNVMGLGLKMNERRNVTPVSPSVMPDRLADIMKYVLKPCFNNLTCTDNCIWTGSTSEGFAITDHSGDGQTYLNDEMDVMIPLASVMEADQSKPDGTCPGFKKPCPEQNSLDEVADDDSKASSNGPGSAEGFSEQRASSLTQTNKPMFGSALSGHDDMQIKSLALLVNELKDICSEDKLIPPSRRLEWVQTSQTGYVRVRICHEMIDFVSDDFIQNLCDVMAENGEQRFYLSRSKLLKIQENYVRSRIPVVQDDIDRHCEKHGGFHGRVKLVQQGPVETLSIVYQVTSMEGTASATTAEYEQTADGALVLTCHLWPSIAQPWITRERKWPSKDLVQSIVRSGCHVVPKSYPGEGGDDNLQWRLSFSLAERTLAHSFTEHQRIFYLVMKKIWRTYLKEPKVLSSYHMKTTMFWVSEKTGKEGWEQNQYGYRYIDYFNQLIKFLANGDVPNFFTPENNMISHIPQIDIIKILEKVRDVRQKPLVYLTDLVVPVNTFSII